MADVRLVVVGAGVIGLAVAREAALRGIETMVLEAGENFGTETSSRNSEVIHAGIYYPAGSLKARHCVAGRKLLYKYVEERNVPFRRCGKLIVANSDEEDGVLKTLKTRAGQNGLTGADALQYLDAGQVAALEPEVRAQSGLFSPATGIVDSHALMLMMQGDAQRGGAETVFRTHVSSLVPGTPHLLAGTSDGDEWQLTAEAVVVAAGLHSTQLMQQDARLQKLAPEVRFVKGSYFALSGKSPFSHLVYPVPSEQGLGVHATLDMGGCTRFGPDTEAVDEIDYHVDAGRQGIFEGSIRRYWPGLADGRLMPAYSGIRPKLYAGGSQQDFLIQGPEEFGMDGLVFLHGIESPGLTASMSLAGTVCDRLSF